MAPFRLRARTPAERMRLRGALLAAFCLGAVLCLWGVFVLSHRGQVLEAAALKGSEIGAHYVTGHARTLLSVVSMQAAAGLVAVILLIGLLRRSHRRAVWAVIAVVGSNLSAQALKYWILWRPDYDISARWDNANTLPSGHTTMATSAAVALILLSGRRWRALSAWAGALFAIAMGYSTLVCQWHRPSDVLAAVLVPVAWGAVAVAGGAWDSAFYGAAPHARAEGAAGDSGAEESASPRGPDHS
ncbi:phosphatase PAP2 family protein, partial [Actinomyces gerencseriae]|uniref:phosphatase PAP2 family protein n=1 Tax=Actinomyces gerencseriae TaxID=52769 RepID=UPI003C6CA7F6